MIEKPLVVIAGLNRPRGVLVTNNGEIVVAERDSHCITILNKKKDIMRSFGTWGKNEG